MRLRRYGFTLIEIVMVIMILGVISVVAIPIFTDFSSQAKNSADEFTIGAIKETISNQYMQSAFSGPAAYPTMAQIQTGMTQPIFFNGVTPNEWSFLEFSGGNIVVIYCPHGTTAAGRRYWVYFRVDLGSWTAGSVVEFSGAPH